MKFLKRLALTLALLGAAAPVEAAYKFVHPSGTATWANATDSSSSTTCASMDTANARATAGDIVRMVAGSYTSQVPNPTNNGTSYAAMIQFIGQSVDTLVSFSSDVLLAEKSFVRVAYFKQMGSSAPVIQAGNNVLVDHVGIINGVPSIMCKAGTGYVNRERPGSYGCRIDNVRWLGQYGSSFFRVNDDSTKSPSSVDGGVPDTIITRGAAVACTLSNFRQAGVLRWVGDEQLMHMKAGHLMVIDRMHYSGHVGKGPSGSKTGILGWFYNSDSCVVSNSYFKLQVDSTCAEDMGFKWRENCYDDAWYKDTLIIATMPGGMKAGTEGTAHNFTFTQGVSGCTECLTKGDRNDILYSFFLIDSSLYVPSRDLSGQAVSDYEPYAKVDFSGRWGASGDSLYGNVFAGGTYVQPWKFINMIAKTGADRSAVFQHNTVITYRRYSPGVSTPCRPGSINDTNIPWYVNYSDETTKRPVFRNNLILAPRLGEASWSVKGCAFADTAYLVAMYTASTPYSASDSNVFYAPLISANRAAGQMFLLADNSSCSSTDCNDTTIAGLRAQFSQDAASKEVTDSLNFYNPNWTALDPRVGTTSKAAFKSGETIVGYAGAFEPEDLDEGPTAIVTSPVGGEEWIAGSSHDITWDVSDPGGTGCVPVRTKLYYRIDDGNVWNLIVDDNGWEDPLYGSYSWSIPAITASTARIKVQLYRTGSVVCATDSSAGTFEIVDNVAPDVSNITLSNDEWRLCETNTIGWTASDDVGIDHFVITLEDFGTGHRDTLSSSVNGNSRSFNWVMPYGSYWAPGQAARPRVYAYDGTGNSDSTVRTSLVATYDRQAPVVYVTAPASGTYPLDTTLTVTWIATDCVADDEYLTTALYYENYDKSSYKWKVADVDNGTPSVEVDLSQAPFLLPPLEAGDRIRFWISSSDDYTNEGWGVGPLLTLKETEDVGTVPNKVRDLWAYEATDTSVKLKWTSVGDVDWTELKYDTTPLTQSGAGDFRTHGTTVETQAPPNAGDLDSVIVTGLTPNTRYYFALRHIGNTGTPVETSLVSIPIARTTFKGGLRGSAPRSTRNYPLLGMEMIPYFDSVVDADSFPRNSPGWPVYQGTVSAFSMRDSARKALYGADMIYHMGVNGAARDYDPSYWSRNEYWGVPDSIFKSINPNGVVGVAGGSTSLPCIKRQVAPKDSNKYVVNNRSDLPWDYDDVINWWVGKYGLSGKHVFDAVGGGTYTLPESLFLWSDTQNAGFTPGDDDTCVWGAWYGDKTSPCYGITTGSPGQMNLNILHVDTLTGELDVVERIAQRRMELTFNNAKYVSSNKWQADVYSGDFAAGWPDERLVGIAADAAIDSLDYARTTGARSYIDAYQRFRDASNEFFARAYYWKNIYRTDGLGTMTVNYFAADVPDRMAWDVTDSGEMITYATKGGLSGGPQKFLNPPTAFFYPNSNYPGSQFEPPFGQMEFSRLNSSAANQFAIRWNIYHIDTLGGRYPVTYGTRLPRLRTALGIACMFNNIFVHPTRLSDNNSEYMDEEANDYNFPYLDAKMDWFWLDEAFVNTNTRVAQRWNAWGTGTGKNWLGKPLDDKWQYGLKVTSSADTLLMDSLRVVTSGDPSGLKYYAASSSFNDTSGWSISAAGEWGSITKVTNAPGANGNSCLKISRAKVSHSAPYNLGMYTRGWFPVGKDKRTSIRFRAKADTVTYIQVGLRDAGTGGSSWLENGRCVYLDTTWRTYAHEVGFVSDSVDRHPGQILFQFADTLGTVYLDSVVFYASGVGVIYRRFENGVVFVNPDDTEDKIINVQTLFGDTASYDYANIWSPDDSPANGNNGRVFGYSGAATDTVFAGTPKFIIKRANRAWNATSINKGGKKKKWWEWWINPSGEPTPIK